MKPKLTCTHPDRHVSGIVCGYPLPCPFHTLVIDLTGPVPTVAVPTTHGAKARALRVGTGIAAAMGEKEDE